MARDGHAHRAGWRRTWPAEITSVLAREKMFCIMPPPSDGRRSMNWHHGEYLLTDETARMDLEAVCTLLHSTYWASTRSRDVIEKTLRHSLNFGLFHANRQVGFARVVSDRATVGYLCDVVIAPDHRGHGLGKWVLQIILEHPELRTCRIDLFTRDAQEFYRQFGFGSHKFTNLVRYPPGYAGGGNVAPGS